MGIRLAIIVTGATGQLGGAVIRNLLQKVPANQIVASVRNVAKAAPLAELGIEVRHGDYMDPESLVKSFAGANKLLFISSPDADDPLRVVQHANVVKAARDAGVKQIAYTSSAFGETFRVPTAYIHMATEWAIRTTGIPYTFLRNSVYRDLVVNPGLKAAVERGELITNTGTGRLNAVTVADLALAAATVLTQEGHANKSYELVSPETWSFEELAKLLSELSGKPVVHRNVSFAEAKADLEGAGLPGFVADLFARIYGAIAAGDTAQTSTDLQNLIGRVTPLAESVKQALQA